MFLKQKIYGKLDVFTFDIFNDTINLMLS